MLSTLEASRRIGAACSSVRRWAKAGLLPFTPIGKARGFDERAVTRFARRWRRAGRNGGLQ